MDGILAEVVQLRQSITSDSLPPYQQACIRNIVCDSSFAVSQHALLIQTRCKVLPSFRRSPPLS